MDEVFSVLEKFLHIHVEKISLEARWAENPPTQAKEARMKEYMRHVSFARAIAMMKLTLEGAFWVVCLRIL